ncbi:uncharacterized protein LOC104583810 [Brachypodium distachyon]|uniref:uncharacterized protein LOC104583810 n=1 Tax=Brachypodium distachyon TaxID=15368 RepID=UPI000D0D7599|nr:uncharacterized protein LOC104583810 [Brachypodium distachyon]|eukprot:XP_024317047.1 uncharacterized protein LOC104583810 [Brachypodium distachyon]
MRRLGGAGQRKRERRCAWGRGSMIEVGGTSRSSLSIFSPWLRVMSWSVRRASASACHTARWWRLREPSTVANSSAAGGIDFMISLLTVSQKVLVGLYGSRLGFVTPCDGEISLGPLAFGCHIKLDGRIKHRGRIMVAAF